MRRILQKGSYTIEASIWIPFILFIMMAVLRMGISFFQDSMNRENSSKLQQLDIVSEFYNYQILKEVGEEIRND